MTRNGQRSSAICRNKSVARRDDRTNPNGIFYIQRTAAPWWNLPECYDRHTTVYNSYVRWGSARGLARYH
ncbi:transposase [Roseovarius sp. Pro17]|uniref:transposase n=1 Tax=Roseovarius sp. Pro17 TaxID=3108175 RepID=UPI003A7F5861